MKNSVNGGLRFGVKAFGLLLLVASAALLVGVFVPKTRATSNQSKKQQAPVASVVKTNQPVAGQVDPNEAVLAQFGLTLEGAHSVSSSTKTSN